MELNINNYSSNELLGIFNASEDALTIDKLQKLLFKKTAEVKEASNEDLPESKENLMEFFTKSFFKIVNDYQLYETIEYNERKKEEFISVRKDLLPGMEKTHTVQQNSSMVEKHHDHQPVQTWNSHLKAGVINPLQRKSYTKILNINTRFREQYECTKSTDFTITLPYPIKKVVSMKLGCTEFPRTVYTFSSNLASNYFQLGNPDFKTIDISNGSYSITQLIDVINSKTLPDVSLNYSDYNGKVTIGSNTGTDFSLNFAYDDKKVCPMLSSNIDKNQLTLGWMLGFRGAAIEKQYFPAGQCIIKDNKCCLPDEYLDPINIYSGKSSYTGEAIYDGHGTRYFLLSINDYLNNHNELFISPFKEQSLADNNILAKISTDCCNKCCCERKERIYFGPVDLTKLTIKLFDEFGRLIDINNADYSFTLELEILYDL